MAQSMVKMTSIKEEVLLTSKWFEMKVFSLGTKYALVGVTFDGSDASQNSRWASFPLNRIVQLLF
jgi:hypothetical protein